MEADGCDRRGGPWCRLKSAGNVFRIVANIKAKPGRERTHISARVGRPA
jgi:hypothetical protein